MKKYPTRLKIIVEIKITEITMIDLLVSFSIFLKIMSFNTTPNMRYEIKRAGI